ncbi:MAG: transposase [Candidatus Obscuribacter sp.]|nr:transposase [Candidatus Obscuribacter sp.]
MSQSKQVASRKQEQMTLDLPGLSKVVAKFDGGAVCSDGGLLLLRKADACLGLVELASYAISDERRPEYVQHTVVDMLRQRIYGIAAGYEDCNDAGQLRVDSMHKLALGKDLVDGQALASQPSLSRFENNIDVTSNAALQKLLVHLFVKQTRKAPKVIRLAMDTTCDETYGSQQMTFTMATIVPFAMHRFSFLQNVVFHFVLFLSQATLIR